MAQVDMSRFKPLMYSFGKVHVSGGHSDRAHPMTTKVASEPGAASTTFVKMVVTETWLIVATTGQAKYTASSFGRTSLLDELRNKVVAICDGAADVKENEDYDPMEEVDQDGHDDQALSQTRNRGVKRMRYYKNHAREKIETFDMPVRCP